MKETELEKKNKNNKRKFILVEEFKQYEFCDEIWTKIKEYASIYDIYVNWDSSLERWIKVGDNICNFRFSHIRNSVIPIEKRIGWIKKNYWNRFMKNTTMKKEEILKKTSKILDDNWYRPSKLFKKNDDVVYREYNRYYKGKIIKINKCSIVVKNYKYNFENVVEETIINNLKDGDNELKKNYLLRLGFPLMTTIKNKYSIYKWTDELNDDKYTISNENIYNLKMINGMTNIDLKNELIGKFSYDKVYNI